MEQTESDTATSVGSESPDVERLKEELRQEHDMHLRALADFDNYRRRVDRERASAAQSGKREVILPLLDVIDNFERALRHTDEAPSSLTKGLTAIHKSLLHKLGMHGVTPFESVGEKFDPALHEAIGSVESDEYEPGTVAEEARRGYRLDDEILRPAHVRVAQ